MQYTFADYVLDIESHTLTKNGVQQNIEPQVFDFLHYLVQNPGKLVTRDEMIEAIWAGRIVSESAVSARISALRRAVGDDGKKQAVIKTIARRGIQFVAEVDSHGDADAAPQHTASIQVIRFAAADDGVKIAYATSGDGPTLLHCKHFPSHLELDWAEPTERSLCETLGISHSIIRFDQRGSGLSDHDISDFSADRSAEDLKSVADAAGLDRFAVLGSSSGALIAVHFAVKYPERVSKLILHSGYVDGRSVRNGDSVSDSQDTILKMAEEGWDTPDSAFISGYLSVYQPTARQEDIQLFAKNLQNSCPVENAVRGRRFHNNHSIAHLLEMVAVPTLVIHSRGDAVHPVSEGQKLARGIANAQFVVLDSRNHYPQPQEPCWQIKMDAIHDFLAS